VDAFATRVFEGNPAAVCPLEKWLDDDLLQARGGELFVEKKGSQLQMNFPARLPRPCEIPGTLVNQYTWSTPH
jgi:predicted PhzF superfamily epimerase YddE/YHI9